MLPNTDDTPAEATQLAAYKPVPFPVVGNFGIPKLLIAAWPLVAPWAAVPKTAVHKYNNTFASKGEIRLAEKRLVAPPAGDAILPKDSDQAQLCGFVSTRADQ